MTPPRRALVRPSRVHAALLALAVALATLFAAAPPAHAVAPSASIAGTVIEQGGTTGIPGIEVDLYCGDGDLLNPAGDTTTASDGTYSFTGLTAGWNCEMELIDTDGCYGAQGGGNYSDVDFVLGSGVNTRTDYLTQESSVYYAYTSNLAGFDASDWDVDSIAYSESGGSWEPSARFSLENRGEEDGGSYLNSEAGDFGGLAFGTYKLGFRLYASSSAPAHVLWAEAHPGAAALASSTTQTVSSCTNGVTGSVAFQTTTSLPPTNRVSGSDRYDTAVQVAQQSYPSHAPIVFLATGTNYPDALSAGAAAAKLHGPLLLTAPGSLPSVVSEELGALDPATVVVVGGTSAVSTTVTDQLAALLPDATVTRISGADRFATSRAIAAYAFGSTVDQAYLATGANFPDALSATAAAGAIGAPVILVPSGSDTPDSATIAELQRLSPSTITIAGGDSAITDQYQDNLTLAFWADDINRLSGDDRYETSQAINESAFVSASHVFIATGANFPDALAGSAWAASVDGPLYTVPGSCVPDRVRQDLVYLGATQVTLLGGTSALTTGVAGLNYCPS